MKYYFVTGSSKGIGKSLVETLLHRDGVHVTGISRTNPNAVPGMHFVPLDLSSNAAVVAFHFPELKDAEAIYLVNNAGALGEVGYAGQLQDKTIEQVLNLNMTTPLVLTNKFLAAYSLKKVPLVILNISSGAGKNPIDGWATYCSSKAGLDMFSKVVADELAISGEKHIRIFAVGPGVVDTGMQDQIRTADQQNFSRIQQFIEYKTSGQLADPRVVAEKLLSILDLPEKFADTVFSARDITVNKHTNT